MPNDYISREAASDLLAFALIDDWEPEYAQDRLNDIPAADVVEVVKCRDCVHAPLSGAGYGSEIKWPKIDCAFTDVECPYYCDDTYYSIRPDPEWFCHKGERRPDNAET